jgi:nicotinate-nucleotide adenylyltransferase
MRVGVFGGTFNPPHIGHLILASEAVAQLGLQRLLWVLTPDPPHKQGQPITPLEIRLELLHAAIEDNPVFELSRVEMDRPGPHFAVDTIRLLQLKQPEAELYYLIGGDSLRDLPTWRDPQGLIAAISGLGVMRRPGDAIDLGGLEKEIPGISEKVLFIDAPLLEISASQIRERAEKGGNFRYYLPLQVYHLIDQYGLYRKRDD